ncbi:MAG TPA: Pycsar system effector family protein [Streptomyces sp.]|uniref:Pycsar system effector family protein n=1 Tax=Streptomyces sp. TaxID=1931 RepID=UPI002BD4FA86|nr:Pycsar system effector family protein [Streptomyces sp.]HWU11563.1 Pycsar system effector family protein [Streptomyces sp.]
MEQITTSAADGRTASSMDRTDANLAASAVDSRREIDRTDTKASVLLALNGAMSAGLVSAADADLPTAAKLVGGLSGAFIVVAIVLLLQVVRPRTRIKNGASAGFVRWARLDQPGFREAMREDRRVDDAHALAKLADRKHTLLRWAVDVTTTAVALFAIAGLIAAG